MICRLLIHLSSLVFIFNVFWVCNGDSQRSKYADVKLSYKLPGLKTPPLSKIYGKRSVEEGEENMGDYYDDLFHEPEELSCPEDQYWHVRGLKCVPFDCPGGNQFRDKNTGECILKSYGVTTVDFRGRPSRFLNSRMKSPSKFRLPFGLTLKG